VRWQTHPTDAQDISSLHHSSDVMKIFRLYNQITTQVK